MLHIVCCVKQVPDPEAPASQFVVDESAKKVLPMSGISSVPSQFDTIAVEAALRIRDDVGEAKITILSVGPDGFKDVIKHCLAMGADAAVLVNDPAVIDADHWVVADVLAATVKKLDPVNLIICGRQAVDWDMGVVGSTLAEILDLPCVTIAKAVEIKDGHAVVERVLLDGFETVEAPTPCVVTVSNELGEPRYPKMRDMMRASRKEIVTWQATDIGMDADQLAGRIKLERLYQPKTEIECEFIDGASPQEKAEKLAQRLKEVRLI